MIKLSIKKVPGKLIATLTVITVLILISSLPVLISGKSQKNTPAEESNNSFGVYTDEKTVSDSISLSPIPSAKINTKIKSPIIFVDLRIYLIYAGVNRVHMQINLPSFSSRKYLYISIALLFLIFLIIVSYLSFSPKSQIPKPSEHPADIISTAPVNVNQNTISISKQYSQDNDASMKGKFTPSQPIAKVGDEIIYGKDINFILYIKFPYDLTSASATLYYLKNKILPVAVEDSVILQTEKKKNPKSIGSDIFNNPDKNESLRFKKVQEITNRLKTQEEEVSGEMVSIWFHNVSMPSIPLPQAENIARDKITAIYNQLKNGTITMTQAGNLIKNDPDLPKIDNSYKENAYYLFTARTKEEQSFSFPDLENALWKLSEGEMSPIIRHPDASIPLGSQSEEFYAVIKVNKINNKESGSFNEWLEKQKANYAVTIY